MSKQTLDDILEKFGADKEYEEYTVMCDDAKQQIIDLFLEVVGEDPKPSPNLVHSRTDVVNSLNAIRERIRLL